MPNRIFSDFHPWSSNLLLLSIDLPVRGSRIISSTFHTFKYKAELVFLSRTNSYSRIYKFYFMNKVAFDKKLHELIDVQVAFLSQKNT